MTTDTKKHKIYPSSSGWARGKAIEAEYNSACLRYMVVAEHAPRSQIDPRFAKVGAVHEDWYAGKMGSQVIDREVVVKRDMSNGVEYSGRMDFVMANGEIHETKASFSKNFLYSVINKGRVKKSHLAQLVSYLIEMKQPNGKIIAGYYEEKENGQYVQKGYREFNVQIDIEGHVLVDNVDTGYTVANQLTHRYLAAEALVNQSVADRPIGEGFASPCNYCPLSSVCNKYDSETIETSEFIASGIEAIKNATQAVPKITKEKNHGRRGVTKNTKASSRGGRKSRSST